MADTETIAANIKALTKNAALITQALPSMIMRADLDDAEAVKFKALYPEYSDLMGKVVKQGWIIAHEGELYRIGQPELTISETYVPGTTGTEALFSHIKIDEEGYEYWKVWDGVTGLYNKGDIRRDPNDEQLYICKNDNCTYGPPSTTPDWWDLYTPEAAE